MYKHKQSFWFCSGVKQIVAVAIVRTVADVRLQGSLRLRADTILGGRSYPGIRPLMAVRDVGAIGVGIVPICNTKSGHLIPGSL